MQKMTKNWKNRAKVHLKGSWQNFTSFSCFSAFFDKHIHKMHKITSYIYDLRKILTKKIWSQGTPLGSLGPGSQEALGLGPWGPDDTPVLVVFHVNAKNPNTAGSWCEIYQNTKTNYGTAVLTGCQLFVFFLGPIC